VNRLGSARAKLSPQRLEQKDWSHLIPAPMKPEPKGWWSILIPEGRTAQPTGSARRWMILNRARPRSETAGDQAEALTVAGLIGIV
jgi:hypothetical protein